MRHCGACNKLVHYCATIDEAREHAGSGRCVAIDLASPRWRRDLEAFGLRCARCEVDVGDELLACPRCGGRVEAEMMELGEIA